jgi:putative ABC transport system permease protein
METLLKDIRYGVRMLVRNPGFTLVSVIALALGIGANAAIFSVVNGVLLRPLPFKEPERLMMIRETKLPQFPEFSVASGNFLDWKKQNTVFERLIAFKPSSLNLIGTGDPERLRVLNVTEGFFATLGAQPQLGRDFLAEEDQPGRNNVVILSHGLWQRRFGGDSKILNQAITLNGQSYTVIGVVAATFTSEAGTMTLIFGRQWPSRNSRSRTTAVMTLLPSDNSSLALRLTRLARR